MAELEALRRRWLELVRTELPEAACSRPDWPVRLDHCFARILLDALCGRPWYEVLSRPAYKALSTQQLDRAIALAEAVLRDEADLAEMNRASLAFRGKARLEG